MPLKHFIELVASRDVHENESEEYGIAVGVGVGVGVGGISKASPQPIFKLSKYLFWYAIPSLVPMTFPMLPKTLPLGEL